MPLFVGDTLVQRVYRGTTPVRRIFRGNEEVFRMFAGIRNVKFAALASDVALTSGSTYNDGPSIDITPSSTGAVIGLLASPVRANTGSTADMSIQIERGTTDLLPDNLNQAAVAYTRQLFLDTPNTTTQTTYTLKGQRRESSDTTAALKAYTSLMAFEYPDHVVADVRSTDISCPGGEWTQIASLNVTPPAADAAVRLQMVVAASNLSANDEFRLLRGANVLATLPTTAFMYDSTNLFFPGNFEDWVDFPASTSQQTYSIEADGVTVRARSYLLAEPID